MWRHRAQVPQGAPSACRSPTGRSSRATSHAAAEFWRARGCRYDAALALASSAEEDDLRESLRELQSLGARSAAAIVARRLRERGARGVRLGPRAANT